MPAGEDRVLCEVDRRGGLRSRGESGPIEGGMTVASTRQRPTLTIAEERVWLVQRVQGVLGASSVLRVEPLLATPRWALAMEGARRIENRVGPDLDVCSIAECALHGFPAELLHVDREVVVVYRWHGRAVERAHVLIEPVCIVPDFDAARLLTDLPAEGVVTFAASCPMRRGDEH